MAINQLKEDYPNSQILPIDSKFASLGLTILLNKLYDYQQEGYDAITSYNKIKNIVDNIHAYFTTDTLTYFARGGRLSKVSAFLGNAIKINPILDVDPDGKLRIVDKVRGSKHAINRLIERCKNSVTTPDKQEVLICHADCIDKANELGKLLVEQVGFKSYKTYFMGPIIGSHTGPGLVAVFFLGNKRSYNTSLISENEKDKLKQELNK